jgi:hypothetical protein
MRAIRRSLNLVTLLAVGACATASAGIGPLAEPLSGWESIPVSFEPTPLRAPSYRTGPVRFAGGVVLRSDDPRFGGLSDLRLDASGGLVAVTDAGDLVTARLVAFEGDHRIWSYGRDAADRPSPRTDPGHAFASNEGMEGMVGDGAGGWYVAGEGGGLWHCDPTACEARAAPPETPLAGYRPTGLALDAQTGGLLMLERYYEAPIDTRIRVRRIDRNGQVTAELIALRLPATVDNFEGIATTLNADGSQRVYILSDDNFSDRQRTLLLAFDLTEAR